MRSVVILLTLAERIAPAKLNRSARRGHRHAANLHNSKRGSGPLVLLLPDAHLVHSK